MVGPNYIPGSREATLHTRTTAVEPFGGFDRPFARISWGAIFAGAIIALATQLVLTLIGTAVGLATLNPATGPRRGLRSRFVCLQRASLFCLTAER